MIVKTGDVADMFGLTPQTIRDWVKRPELSDLFSLSARPVNGKHADFTEDDVSVVNSIWYMTQEGNHDWRSIGENLRSGWRHPQLPERAAFVAASTAPSVMLAARTLNAEKQSESSLAIIRQKDDQIDLLNQRLMELEAQKDEQIRQIMDKHAAEKEALLREMTRIERERAAEIARVTAERDILLRLAQNKPPVE